MQALACPSMPVPVSEAWTAASFTEIKENLAVTPGVAVFTCRLKYLVLLPATNPNEYVPLADTFILPSSTPPEPSEAWAIPTSALLQSL